MNKHNKTSKSNRTLIAALALIVSNISFASTLEIEGCRFTPIHITPDKATGLSGIIVVSDLDNVVLKYKSDSSNSPRVSQYSNLGAAYATPIENVKYGDGYIVIENPIGDVGYIFSSETQEEYYWIVNYSNHSYHPEALEISDSSGCDETVLDFKGNAAPIVYYSINGRQEILSRDLNLSYTSLEFDEENHQFVEKDFNKDIASINERISLIPAVTASTKFSLTGDRFLKYWDKSISIESGEFFPIATMVRTQVIEEKNVNEDNESSNQIGSGSEGLGGSAPAEISFLSFISDAVIHCEWQMAKDESFEDITYRFNQQDLTFTFTEEGTTYVRFVGSNNDGSCESYGDIYTVNIGASELLIPNAFSPNGDGINDEWKVSYKSLLDFQCWIFDRHGHELFYFNDPKIGWDGKTKGKYVSPGVYYYVINATGSDGRKFKKSGDINILKSKYQIGSTENQL